MPNKYGARPSTPDQRNFKFPHYSASLPPVVSLLDKAPPTVDQGPIGSCTSNSLANVIRYRLKEDKVAGEDFLPSRLFIYYNERVLENTVNSDSGSTIADGCKVLRQFGLPAEHWLPYDTSKMYDKPSQAVYDNALHRKAVKYMVVNQDINSIKSAIQAGYPVTIGISVYSSFESPEVAITGTVPMPGPSESLLGSHCVSIWKMSDTDQLATAQNSWGLGFGQGGFFTLPYAYLLDPNLMFESWAVELTRRVA